MKAKRIVALVVLLVLALTCIFAACDKNKNLTDEPLKGEMLADFTQGKSDAVYESDGWANGSVFNVVWDKENVTYGEDGMHLGIKQEQRTAYVDDVETTFPYTAGEARTTLNYGYGDFEVSMKPAKKAGTASTFFVCTGPYDTGVDGQPQKHDEIDIEFLGKDTTKVQFNYFVNGVGGHEYMYRLGFDASKEYHTYGFRWTAESITWFVDGKPVYKVEVSAKNPLPSAPGKMLMNYWCGTKAAEGWMGKYSIGNETADYQWVKTNATGVDLNPVEDDPDVIDSKDIPTEGWQAIDYSTFGGWNGYTVTKENGLTISHQTAMDGWKCEGMGLENSYSWVKFTVKNNAEIAANLRIDVKKENGAGGVAGVYCADAGVISLDATESAAMIELAAGQTTEVVLKIKDMTVDQFVIFLNSMQASGGAQTGSVTITDLKGIVNSDPNPNEGGNGEEGGKGSSGTLSANGAEIKFESDGSAYDITQDEGAIKVAYEDISGQGYSSITADIASIVADNNVLTITIKNNGQNVAKVRLDVVGNVGSVYGSNYPYVNLSASYTGDVVDKGNDYVYGGADWVKISAGGTVTCTITFEVNVGAHELALFIDSSTWGDNGTYTGEIVLSNLSLSKKTTELGTEYLPTSEEIINSGKNDDQKKDDTWMLWWAQDVSWGCGDAVTMEDGWATYDDGVNFSYSGGSVNFSVQLFYQNTALQQGKQYVLKCTIVSSVEMDITVNGKPVTLSVGSNEIEVQFTCGALSGDGSPMAAVDIQFWGVGEGEASFGVKDVKWIEVVE